MAQTVTPAATGSTAAPAATGTQRGRGVGNDGRGVGEDVAREGGGTTGGLGAVVVRADGGIGRGGLGAVVVRADSGIGRGGPGAASGAAGWAASSRRLTSSRMRLPVSGSRSTSRRRAAST